MDSSTSSRRRRRITTCNAQLATRNLQHATCNTQRARCNTQVTKDELVDLFLKETENTPDGDFAAQLDLSVVRCDAPDGRAPKGLHCCLQGGRRGRQRRSSPAPIRPLLRSAPLRGRRACRPPRLALLVVCAQCRRAPESARERSRLGMVPADGCGSVCEACIRVRSRSSRRCAVAAVCRDPIGGAVPPRPCIQLEVVARLVRDALQQDRPQQGADVASSSCNAHSAGADVAAFRTAT